MDTSDQKFIYIHLKNTIDWIDGHDDFARFSDGLKLADLTDLQIALVQVNSASGGTQDRTSL